LPEGPALSRQAEGTFRCAEVVQGARSASLLLLLEMCFRRGTISKRAEKFSGLRKVVSDYDFLGRCRREFNISAVSDSGAVYKSCTGFGFSRAGKEISTY
jgi:hypothetical protein